MILVNLTLMIYKVFKNKKMNVKGKIKEFFKNIWLGIKISNENYLNGKTHQGNF
jgi:hypothetical protein